MRRLISIQEFQGPCIIWKEGRSDQPRLLRQVGTLNTSLKEIEYITIKPAAGKG